ncbi:MAG: DUF2911 domain-containing protein [Flavobacteriaceae bacterium]|nr:DUF2911 domain-containing protein [Flavobacteriaceae bacterium]
MKKIITSSVFVICLFISNHITAQFEHPVKLPPASPKAKVYQQIGVTDISISYHRPLAKGREIFGKLIPFGKVWRTGADENTVIKFSTDVTINGNNVKAGAYGLHTIPNKDNWTVILNKETKAWGSYFYDKNKDVVRFNVATKKAPHTESMTFNFTNSTPNKTTVELSWADTSISFNIEANTDALVNKNIKKQLNSLPWWGWTGLYNAARYNLNKGIYLEDALIWINRSIQNNKNFSNLSLKAQILAKQGNKAQADKINKEALSVATNRELQRAAFFKFRAKDNKAGIDILKHAIKNNASNYQSYTVMAWGYQQIKDKKNAQKMYKKALRLAPKDKKDAIKEAMKKL